MRPVKPPRLRRGDVIGLIAPASAPEGLESVQASVRYLEGLGYRVETGRHVGARHGYFAGTDAQRREDLNDMLRDPRVKAVFALRGGYGTPRLLPFIDYRALRRQPKVIAGFSDLTALQLAVFRKTGLVTFSGPMPAVDFCRKPNPYAEEQFWRLLTSTRPIGRLPVPPSQPLRIRRAGTVSGPLLGGTLSLVVSSLGTPFSPNYRGALLVLEDVGEQFHRLDRMFTQLRNAGTLHGIAGLLLGQFTGCSPARPNQSHLSWNQLIEEVMPWFDGPVLENLPYGHVRRKLTIPLGLTARLDTRRGRLEIPESAVS